MTTSEATPGGPTISTTTRDVRAQGPFPRSQLATWLVNGKRDLRNNSNHQMLRWQFTHRSTLALGTQG